jgi:hypothetical protein
MDFVWFSEYTAIISKNNITQVMFVMEKCSVLFVVRTEFVFVFQMVCTVKFRRVCHKRLLLTTLTSSLSFYPYQKDERALPGYLLIRCPFSLRPTMKCVSLLPHNLFPIIPYISVTEQIIWPVIFEICGRNSRVAYMFHDFPQFLTSKQLGRKRISVRSLVSENEVDFSKIMLVEKWKRKIHLLPDTFIFWQHFLLLQLALNLSLWVSFTRLYDKSVP